MVAAPAHAARLRFGGPVQTAGPAVSDGVRYAAWATAPTTLVVADTVNTMPEKTMDAFGDHGEVIGDTVTGLGDEAQATFDQLSEVGIDFPDVMKVLEDEGVEKFVASWHELTDTVQTQMDKAK